MDGVFTPCAGLDVHKKSITACRMVPDPTSQDGEGVAELQGFCRKFLCVDDLRRVDPVDGVIRRRERRTVRPQSGPRLRPRPSAAFA